jgi:hypothetical protein
MSTENCGPGEVVGSSGFGKAIRRGPYKPTNTEILREKKQALENELKRVNEALQALEEHPEIEKVMNLVQQAMY